GVYDDAKKIGRHAVLKYRAELIQDYETIEKPLGSKRGNPRYIYYIGKPDYIEEWLKKSEKTRKSHEKTRKRHENFLSKLDDDSNSDGDDNDDDDDLESIASSPRKEGQEVPLSLYWFVDESNDDKKKVLNTKPSIIASSPIFIQNDNNNSQDESKLLKEKIQS